MFTGWTPAEKSVNVSSEGESSVFAAQINGCSWLKCQSNNITIMKTAKTTKTKTVITAAPVAKRAVAPAPAIAPKTQPVVAAAPAPAPKTQPVAAVAPLTPAPARKITTEQIARRAYCIWAEQGRPTGKDTEHWLLAEKQLLTNLSLTE